MPPNAEHHTVASPPLPPSAKSDTPTTIDALTTYIDALLTLHLQLLDTYTNLRTELSTQFSSGFLSLAAANRNAAATLGPGRRFGEEGFDGRMKAGKVVSIQRPGAREERRTSMRKTPTEAKPAARDPDMKTGHDLRNEIPAQDTAGPTGTPATEHPVAGTTATTNTQDAAEEADDNKDDEDEDENEEQTPSLLSQFQDLSIQPLDPELAATLQQLDNLDDPGISLHLPLPLPSPPPSSISIITTTQPTDAKPRNPLTWYTALPPPALRQTQTHFTASLPTIACLITVTRLLDAVDVRVGAVRTQLGELQGWERDENDAGVNQEGVVPIPIGGGDRGGGGGRKGASHFDTLAADEVVGRVDVAVGSDDRAGVEEWPSRSKNDQSASSTSPLKSQIASRSMGSEPRSRVLKMR